MKMQTMKEKNITAEEGVKKKGNIIANVILVIALIDLCVGFSTV